MKAVLLCGLLAFALGATVKDKLSVKAGDTMGNIASISAYQLLAGTQLAPGQSLTSPDGKTTLTMQTGGNLVLSQGTTTLWKSGTSTTLVPSAKMQTNGNFIVYGGTTVLWASNTAGSGVYLQVQNDANLVVYSSGSLMLWSWKYGLLANPAALNMLPAGGKLSSGMYLVSTNGQIRLTMQSDGNLAVYQSATLLWSSGTSGHSGAYALMQTNGNFTVFGGTTVLWSSNTAGWTRAYLKLNDDANFVIYSSGNMMLWSGKYGLLANPTAPNKLPSGAKLFPGMYIVSPDGHFALTIKSDGNPDFFYIDTTSTYRNNPSGTSGIFAWMQTDGNFVVYHGSNVMWVISNGFHQYMPYLQVNDEFNFAIFDGFGRILFESDCGALPINVQPSKLSPGQYLGSGLVFVSPMRKLSLVMQTDGNLVLFQDGNGIWSSYTAGHPGAYAIMEANGNFTVYEGTTALWTSGTGGHPGAYLWLQGDSNLVVYSPENLMLWSWKYGRLANPATPNTLNPDVELLSGTYLVSPNGQTRLTMQSDGNLALYQLDILIWTTGTSGHSGACALAQLRGNFTVYEGTTVLWSSNTAEPYGAYVQVNDDTYGGVYNFYNLMLLSFKYGRLANRAAPNQLPSGMKLLSGTYLVSPNGQILLTMQSDGNLVLYQNGNAFWSSGTAGILGVYALMQTDGNFVVYVGPYLLWSSGTAGWTRAYLQVQDDFNAVIYNSGGMAVWSTRYGLV